MKTSYDKSDAVVVLPPIADGRLQDTSLRSWLARSRPAATNDRREILDRVLDELQLPIPTTGRAAMCFWGQTGQRPTKWMASADPVYLEPHLDRLCLHAIRPSDITAEQLRRLFDHLQATLCGNAPENTANGFLQLGDRCYISASGPLATANCSATAIDLLAPDDFLPGGEGGPEYRNLVSEVEMALHEHDVNRAREANGQRPVNSLWLWGGGVAPEVERRPLPQLFANDAALTGYWLAAGRTCSNWPGDLASCISATDGGFVAEVPEQEDDPSLLSSYLREVRTAIQSGQLKRATLMFRDGIRVDVRASDRLRFWRRNSAIIG